MVIVVAVVAATLAVGAVVALFVTHVTAAQVARHLAAGDRAAGSRDESLRHELHEMAGRLDRVTGVVADLRADRAGQHGELLERVSEATRVTESLRSTTEGLQRALASPQARGQWGERMAEDVLRAVGFVEGVNYRKQATLPSGTRPDITFLLPDERLLHMDVKFPLAGYLRWCEATTDRTRADALAGFLRDVRARVKELARAGYADETTVGFTLAFIPNEAVYGFIHANDSAIADEAMGQRVVLCSPFTLFAVLGVIRQASDAIAVQRGADEVLEILAGFSKQWEQFTDRLEALGRNLQTTQNAYEQVNGPRRRQLERQLDKVEAVRRARGPGSVPSSADPAVLREVSSW